MTEPTLESLNEAARAAGCAVYAELMINRYANQAHATDAVRNSVLAHALTLDELHGRKEASEAETFFREVVALQLGVSRWKNVLDGGDRKAIALIDAKFAELRKPKEPEWIEWHGGECPVALETRVEVKFRDGLCSSEYKAGTWNWKNLANDDEIIAYRVLS